MSTSKHLHACMAKSVIFDRNVSLECRSSNNTDLFLPNANGRNGQFLSIIDGRMKWVDPPNSDIIKLSGYTHINPDVNNAIITIDYQAKHDDPHPIALIGKNGDFERIINYYFIKLTTDQVSLMITTKANLNNLKFSNLTGVYRNIKAINSSNGMLMVVYINQNNRVILNKCMTEDGDGYFICNETDIIVPANVLDIYPLHDKKLGIVHNDHDNNVNFTSCNLPDGNGVKTTVIIDNCKVSIIKLVATRTETIVISYITDNGCLYYAYFVNDIWQIKMLSNNIKVVCGYLDMITFNGQSIGIIYYNINHELNFVFTTDILDETAWKYVYIDNIEQFNQIQLLHLDNNNCLVLIGNKIYYHNKSVSFDDIRTVSIIKLNNNHLCLIGTNSQGLYSYVFNYNNDSIVSKGLILANDKIIETSILYTSTGSLIISYLTDQPGILVSPFDDRFAYDLDVTINCLIK